MSFSIMHLNRAQEMVDDLGTVKAQAARPSHLVLMPSLSHKTCPDPHTSRLTDFRVGRIDIPWFAEQR